MVISTIFSQKTQLISSKIAGCASKPLVAPSESHPIFLRMASFGVGAMLLTLVTMIGAYGQEKYFSLSREKDEQEKSLGSQDLGLNSCDQAFESYLSSYLSFQK